MTGSVDLDALYAAPSDAVTRAITDHLTDFHFAYLAAATFCCVASTGADGLDVSPRGGRPGFVHALDRRTVAIADWPGNNRVETLRNVQADPRLGFLFIFPGLDIFMRVNGSARLSAEPALLARLSEEGRTPRTALVLTVEQALFHCGKAITRARLWDGSAVIDRRRLPTPGQMMKALAAIEEADAATLDAYYAEGMQRDLY